jgi:hypothetical protein
VRAHACVCVCVCVCVVVGGGGVIARGLQRGAKLILYKIGGNLAKIKPTVFQICVCVCVCVCVCPREKERKCEVHRVGCEFQQYCSTKDIFTSVKKKLKKN